MIILLLVLILAALVLGDNFLPVMGSLIGGLFKFILLLVFIGGVLLFAANK